MTKAIRIHISIPSDRIPVPEEELRKEWESAGIGNAFLFGKVMSSRPDLLLELLQHALPDLHIRRINAVGREVDIRMNYDSHGVRLDITVMDDKGRFIDVEMQMRDEGNLPKRMRYYTSTIDQTILNPGMNYSEIPDTVILFISPRDPFGRDQIRYIFKEYCVEEEDMALDDGTLKVVLNAEGTKGNVSSDLKGFLDLLTEKNKTEPVRGSFADRVRKGVSIAKKDSKWRKEYMDWKMTLLNERTKGREEGRLLERIQTVAKKIKKGMTIEACSEAIEADPDEIRPIWEAVLAMGEDADPEEVLKAMKEQESF